jgi:predicted ATP-grasp superfamily ATP-dependent carboligase
VTKITAEHAEEELVQPHLSGARVLVLDGEQRVALAVARSLHRARFDVFVTSRGRWSLGTATRGAHRLQVTHDPVSHPDAYATGIADLARRIHATLVLPLTDASVESVLEHRHLFPPEVVIPFAGLETYRAASDKLAVNALACEVGLGIAESEVVPSPADGAPANPALYPGVIKPHRSVVGAGSGARRKLGVRQVADRAACDAALRDLPAEAFPVLVQRRVRGPGEAYFTARWGGRTLATFAHRRLREKPPSGGVSVYSESVPVDPALQQQCEGLLDRLQWDGVAMVECKRDLDYGGWRIMEINGRFWGSLQLAVFSGVDFPRLLAQAALGAPVGPPPSWRAGVRMRWEWGDVDHLLVRLRRSRERLSLPPDAPGRLGALAAFLAVHPGRDHLEVFRVRDPLPFVVETLARMGIAR